MKKKFLLLGTAIPIIIIVLYIKYYDTYYITKYVHKNHTDLEAYCEKIRENTIYTADYYEKYEVEYWPSTGIVEFMFKDYFFHSPYKGFYYSHSDKPLGFQGTDIEFTKQDQGWIWYEEDGDNWEYTEKIMDKWYWFEIHF